MIVRTPQHTSLHLSKTHREKKKKRWKQTSSMALRSSARRSSHSSRLKSSKISCFRSAAARSSDAATALRQSLFTQFLKIIIKILTDAAWAAGRPLALVRFRRDLTQPFFKCSI